MIIRRLEQVNKDIIDNVILDYESGNFFVADLSKKYHLDYNVVLSILFKEVSNEEIVRATIDDNQFIVISDTHIGSELEKIKYLDVVYEYAIKNKIKTIIHAGDLMQSSMRPVQPSLVNEEKQLNYVINKYPYNKKIKNYILLGNHDLHILKKNDNYIRIINSRKDFNILGFKHAYLKWCNNLISVSHPIDNYKIVLPSREYLLRLIGHRHSMSIKNDNTITVPSLSLDIKNAPDTLSLPGFLVVKKEDDMMNVYHYVFFEKLQDSKDKMERLLLQNSDTSFDDMGIVLSRKLSDNKIK